MTAAVGRSDPEREHDADIRFGDGPLKMAPMSPDAPTQTTTLNDLD